MLAAVTLMLFSDAITRPMKCNLLCIDGYSEHNAASECDLIVSSFFFCIYLPLISLWNLVVYIKPPP